MVKIGFIGAGDISLLHRQAIERCPGAELRGLWNITPELAEEKCALFGCRNYESAEELVADPEIDAVFVLTTLETHAQYARLAMEAGKHVLVEKPVGASVDELDKLKALSESRGVVLAPGHNYIHEDGLQRTRELIAAGKLGKLVATYIHFHVHHPEEAAKRYPGVIRQLLTHHAYILLYLAGEPESVMAMKSVVSYEEYEEEDIAMVNIAMKDGSLAHFCASFAADDNSSDPWTFVVKVIGTDGATRFSYRDWVENKPGPIHAHTWSAYHYGIINEVRYFVDECLGRGTPPLSTIDDAIVCQRFIEACEESIREQRQIRL